MNDKRDEDNTPPKSAMADAFEALRQDESEEGDLGRAFREAFGMDAGLDAYMGSTKKQHKLFTTVSVFDEDGLRHIYHDVYRAASVGSNVLELHTKESAYLVVLAPGWSVQLDKTEEEIQMLGFGVDDEDDQD